MYRFLLTPRWLGINLFTVLAIPFCVFMGMWQLGRFEDRVDTHREAESRPAVSSAPAVPLDDVLRQAPSGQYVEAEDSGRPVTASGRYDTENQFTVPGRTLHDEQGHYVLTLLRTEGGDGPALPVVRGWLPGEPGDPADVPAPPSGEVTVEGYVQAAETVDTQEAHTTGGLPEGQVGMVSAASLVNIVPYPVHNVWITLPEAEGAMEPVPPVAPKGGGLDVKAFQNLGYTGEWFVFGGFVVFMWFRFFRREVEVQRDIALGLTEDPAAEGPPPGGTGDGPGPDSDSGPDGPAGSEGPDGPAASGAPAGAQPEAAGR
ncbi:SURF1 family protein [Streptomyces sp. SCUT-3]|uniref:SURF1 family protein n=1 Tax=Streptomyces TaxID=1883 RepID=UPI0015FCCF4D|nr:SURF1 family protein [Streptomyces sp. SCUT-3]QMV22612.1 SURF1 family protein [Streptomyces sp. SCUT-3]